MRSPSSPSSARGNELRGVSPRSLPSQRMPDPWETCYLLRIRPLREGSGRGKHPLVRWRKRRWRREGGGGGGGGGGGSVEEGGGGERRRRSRRRGMPIYGEWHRICCPSRFADIQISLHVAWSNSPGCILLRSRLLSVHQQKIISVLHQYYRML